MTIRLRIISLGAGVQSTTMALMAAHGDLEMPDCAIFADTGAEPQSVYDHLAWLMSSNVLPFPVHIVTAGNLRQHIVEAMAGDRRMDNRPPFFNATGGPINRQCTTKHKIEPIKRKVKELMALGRDGEPSAQVEQWIGISTDEVSRMKPARDDWQINRWPLIEKNMSRYDCLGWLDRHGYPRAPKSACTFCPYRNTEGWRRMKADEPAAFADAVAIDRLIRPGMPGSRKPQSWFVHYSCKPLDEIDFSTPESRGQLDLFNNECEGMCGV